ncbi:uncharacterized protein PG998_012337 [Apiospora kogelbergensis]|uniref:uncharacterized protein n=1 Tax=Apiospora kogelbergensis TaxID=1337665 RepID=UPI00312E122D
MMNENENNSDNESEIENFGKREFNAIRQVLADLTIGKIPIAWMLPLLLTMHQERFAEADDEGNRIKTYFHPRILRVHPLAYHTSATKKTAHPDTQPVVNIMDHVEEDMQLRWRVLRRSYRSSSEEQRATNVSKYGVYRFLFFIHEHFIREPTNPYQNTVYTVSIWDREWDELIWHDVYPYGRKERRAAIHHFWTRATTNFLPEHLSASDLGRNTVNPEKIGTMRFNTTYHAYEDPNYRTPPPRETISFVLALAVYHVNEATYDDQVVMPKTDDYIWGQRTELIPRLIFCGLVICLESEHLPVDNPAVRQNFLGQVSVSKRLKWLREGLLYYIDQADWSPETLLALRLEWPLQHRTQKPKQILISGDVGET